MTQIVTDLVPSDLDWMLALNRHHEALLSPLDPGELAALVAKARLVRVIRPHAFMIVMDADASYDSPHYLWFRDRYTRFLYVDRIAVAVGNEGKGIGRQLYSDLFEQAAMLGTDHICAEVNSDPPNTASLVFHERLGFDVVGELSVPDRGKTVRCFLRKMI